MKIEMLNPSELIPYKNNPRKNENAIDKVATSISKYGFKQPIVIDKNNMIIVGHTRWKAALKMGLKEVPVLKADDLTPAQAKAYRIADNKTNEFAEWDWEGLDIELDELKELDLDIDWLEFSKGKYIGWNPEKTEEAINGDNIFDLVNYGLQSFWKNITNENARCYEYQIDLPYQPVTSLVRQKYSRTNLEEIQRIILTYMRQGDYFLESCCGSVSYTHLTLPTKRIV